MYFYTAFLSVNMKQPLLAFGLVLLGFKRHRTTAYHPQPNGMLERWHRPLKAVRLGQGNPSWPQVQSVVLLDFRTANREEFAASPAELVYGENLRVPSDPVLDIRSGLNTTDLLRLLNYALLKLKSPPPAKYAKTVVDVPRNLESYTHILIRTDASRSHVERHPPAHSLNVGGTVNKVSLARLKPFFQEENTTRRRGA